jgi:hypothetical protein
MNRRFCDRIGQAMMWALLGNLSLLLAVMLSSGSLASGCPLIGDADRAKSGPNAVQVKRRSAQEPYSTVLTAMNAKTTERPGFEPGIRV